MYCRIKNSVNYDKKHNNTKNIRAYSHIADIYRLCLYKIEHYINHDQKNTKKQQRKTFENMHEYSIYSRYTQVMPSIK